MVTGKARSTAIAAVLLIVAAAFAAYRWRATGTGSPQSLSSTVQVERGAIQPTLTVTGYVGSVSERQVSATASGRIKEVYVKVGDAVAPGQALAKLDGTATYRQLSVTEASLSSARARLQELKDKSTSSAEIAAQDAAVARAKADYQSAVDDYDATTLKSPIAGTVIAMTAAVGDSATGGGSAAASGSGSGSSQTGTQSSGSNAPFTVADLGQLEITANIDQADIPKVSTGQAVKISLAALPDKHFSGRVVGVDPVPQTSQNVVTYTAHISFDKLDPSLRLGMSADLEIDLGKKENVLVVPNLAVRNQGNSKVVTKMVDGQPTEVPVETGLSDSQRTEITSGLSAGDEVLLRSFSSTTQQSGGTGSSGRSFGGGFGGGFSGPGMMGQGRRD